jgi:hypothetical protein
LPQPFGMANVLSLDSVEKDSSTGQRKQNQNPFMPSGREANMVHHINEERLGDRVEHP